MRQRNVYMSYILFYVISHTSRDEIFAKNNLNSAESKEAVVIVRER
jgi:hypothetical protein